MPCSRSAGTPKPSRKITSSSGSPRNTSVYAAANARTGTNTGPRSVRSTAMARPRTAISTPQTSITRMFSQRPVATAGSASQARAGSKKVSRTLGQPGVAVTPATRAATSTTELTTAMTVDRVDCRRRKAIRSSSSADGCQPLVVTGYGRSLSKALRQAQGALASASGQDGRAVRAGQPLLLQLLQRAVGLQRVDGRADARGERTALGQHHSELVRRARAGRQLTDDRSVVELRGRDVERRRQVDHDAVDLPVLQRLDGEVVGVVDGRLGGGLDLLGDGGVGGGAHLGGQFGVLELRNRLRPGDR